MEDLPGPLRLSSAFPFVGRSATMAALRKLMPSAAGQGRRVALLSGEPGSGKTRLARQFAREMAADGALVLYGACDAVVRTPYGPFVEALDHLVRVLDPAELRAAIGPGGGELARLLPDLTRRVGELPPPLNADADTERHRLHTAVGDLLAGVTRQRPVLLVLEDGHWADTSTLLLLRYLVRAAGSAHMLLLATFRDTELEVPGTLADTLADLRRSDDVVRLRLEGLSHEEVADLVRAAASGEFGPELHGLAQSIRDLTSGNAFLVCELWRAMVETGAVSTAGRRILITRPPSELTSPDSVREVVSQRLGRLSPGTRGLLELAATAGTKFGLGIVRNAAGLTEAEFLAAFDEAVRSGMVEELPRGPASGRFTHELVRRAVYDRLSAIRRAQLHLRVAAALEADGSRPDQWLADLAHHYAAAAPFGDKDHAVSCNLRAATAATAVLAFDEAADRLRTALELGIDQPAQRADALLELGSVSHRGGKSADALQAFGAAADLARETGDRRLLARAAIGYEEACWRPSIVGEGATELLEEAAALLDDENSPLRAGLLSGLARVLDFQGDHVQAAAARTDAITMARALGDRSTLALILVRCYWSRGFSPLDEILATLTEARELARELGDTEMLVESMAWRVVTLAAQGNLDAARREIAELLATAERTGQPFMHHVADQDGSALALCDGRLGEAEALARRSHEWSRLLTGRDASGIYGIQMFNIRREQGRLADIASVVRILASDANQGWAWRPGLAALLAEVGMEAEAKRELARLTADGLDQFRQSLWLPSLTYLADATAALQDERAAALLYPEFAPLAGANLVIGHIVSCYGAADRYLGMLASVLGDTRRAEEHFERALELNRRMGARTWVAHTAYEYARFLLARGGQHDRVQVLAGEAATLAKRIGMPTLLDRIARLGPVTPPPTLPDGLSPREVQVLGLVAGGLSNRDIGAALSISEHTAANHVRSILAKSGCANRAEAVSYAHRKQLIAQPTVGPG